jgi:RNA recognition motif-containing protein
MDRRPSRPTNSRYNDDDVIDRERERFGYKPPPGVEERRGSFEADPEPYRRNRADSDAGFRDNKRPRTEEAPIKRYSIYVACFPPSFEERDLRDFFRDCEEIESVFVNHKDRNKKYAFVNFRSERAREYALRKNGMLIGNMPIVVEIPDAGKRRASPPRGGSGSGSGRW